jgi:hypothetical protein
MGDATPPPSLTSPRTSEEEWKVLRTQSVPVFWIAWSMLITAKQLLGELEKL